MVVTTLLSLLLKTFLVQPFWIPSESMEPTLVPGDRVVVNKLTPGPFDLHRGDVVVFQDPNGWLGPRQDTRPGAAIKALEFVGLYPAGDNHLIKRIIGMPGDRVKCCAKNGRLTVNGQPITESYVASGAKPSEMDFDITVPEGRVWVMGDNRRSGSSLDSRAYGPVDLRDVAGTANLRLWPRPGPLPR